MVRFHKIFYQKPKILIWFIFHFVLSNKPFKWTMFEDCDSNDTNSNYYCSKETEQYFIKTDFWNLLFDVWEYYHF